MSDVEAVAYAGMGFVVGLLLWKLFSSREAGAMSLLEVLVGMTIGAALGLGSLMAAWIIVEWWAP